MSRPKPRRVESIPGMGKVYDFRNTGLLSGVRDSQGRIIKINPRIYTEHIPVYPNKPGIEDFYGLADVLKRQGLSLQHATDRDGNVCLYTGMNHLCYQARGANSLGPGCEHMHMTVNESWTRRQLRASAYLWYMAWKVWDIPPRRGDLNHGPSQGLVRVERKGHVTHKEVSIAARYFDRSDPGPGYDFEYVRHAFLVFRRKHSFVGA